MLGTELLMSAEVIGIRLEIKWLEIVDCMRRWNPRTALGIHGQGGDLPFSIDCNVDFDGSEPHNSSDKGELVAQSLLSQASD